MSRPPNCWLSAWGVLSPTKRASQPFLPQSPVQPSVNRAAQMWLRSL
jgi:hypothetical protein